jgi:hypothetical protein
VFELILEEELFGLQDALEEDRADEAIAALYLILERRLADMLTPVADDVANAVRRAVLRELNELALDNLASLSLKAFSRSVSKAIARGFREARIIAAEPLPTMMPDERGQMLRQFRARPPRSTKFTTIRMVEAHAVKVYEKRGKQRLALVGPDGKILRSLDVAASGGIETGADSILKHAPTRGFPDAVLVSRT